MIIIIPIPIGMITIPILMGKASILDTTGGIRRYIIFIIPVLFGWLDFQPIPTTIHGFTDRIIMATWVMVMVKVT